MFYPNIGFLFAEIPLKERFLASKISGFDIVECPDPYGFSLDELKSILAESGVSIKSINTPCGNVAAGKFGSAGIPGQEKTFAAQWNEALAYAVALDIKKVHVTAGIYNGSDRDHALKTYVSNIRRIAPEAADRGITLLLEPINQRDKPGYLVSHSDELVQLIKEIDEPNVKLLFDVYHIQIMDGDIITRIHKYAHEIGHVQIAAVPSRNEPDSGEINYEAVFSALKNIAFTDPIALEYKPRNSTIEGLAWINKFK